MTTLVASMKKINFCFSPFFQVLKKLDNICCYPELGKKSYFTSRDTTYKALTNYMPLNKLAFSFNP
jgi:hypothetical protein